jgi:hypothetical protein
MPHDKVTWLNLRDVGHGAPQVKVWMHDLIQFLTVTESRAVKVARRLFVQFSGFKIRGRNPRRRILRASVRGLKRGLVGSRLSTGVAKGSP